MKHRIFTKQQGRRVVDRDGTEGYASGTLWTARGLERFTFRRTWRTKRARLSDTHREKARKAVPLQRGWYLSPATYFCYDVFGDICKLRVKPHYCRLWSAIAVETLGRSWSMKCRASEGPRRRLQNLPKIVDDEVIMPSAAPDLSGVEARIAANMTAIPYGTDTGRAPDDRPHYVGLDR